MSSPLGFHQFFIVVVVRRRNHSSLPSAVVLVAPGNPCKTALRSGLSEIKEYVSFLSPKLEFWLFLSSSVLVVVVRRRPSSALSPSFFVNTVVSRRRFSSFAEAAVMIAASPESEFRPSSSFLCDVVFRLRCPLHLLSSFSYFSQ